MKSLVLFSFLVTRLAFGDFLNGGWSGTGQAMMKPGTPKEHLRACSSIELSFAQTKDRLQLLQGDYVCGDLKAAYDPAIFEIHGGEIWYEGKKIGSLSDESFSIAYVDPSDGSIFHLTLTRAGKSLNYLEEWSDRGVTQLRVQGVLAPNSATPRISP